MSPGRREANTGLPAGALRPPSVTCSSGGAHLYGWGRFPACVLQEAYDLFAVGSPRAAMCLPLSLWTLMVLSPPSLQHALYVDGTCV